VLDRLDRLTQDEARSTAAHAPATVHGLTPNMKEFMDGEQSTRFVNLMFLEYYFPQTAKRPLVVCGKSSVRFIRDNELAPYLTER